MAKNQNQKPQDELENAPAVETPETETPEVEETNQAPIVESASKTEVKLEDTKEFKDLVENNSLSDLKEMLIAEEMLGAEFIDNKKVAAAAILTLKKKKEERAAPAPGEVLDTPAAPVVAPTVQDQLIMNKWKSKTQKFKEYCATCPKVRVMIPFDIGEKPGAAAELQINGYKLTVLKGIYVDIPEPFAEMVQESWNQTLKAGEDLLLDRVDPATGKPMRESQALT